MTYDEYKNHLKVGEFLGKPPTGKYGELHSFLSDLWEDSYISLSDRESIILFHQDGRWIVLTGTNSKFMFNEDFWTPLDDITSPNTNDILNNLLNEQLHVMKSGTDKCQNIWKDKPMGPDENQTICTPI